MNVVNGHQRRGYGPKRLGTSSYGVAARLLACMLAVVVGLPASGVFADPSGARQRGEWKTVRKLAAGEWDKATFRTEKAAVSAKAAKERTAAADGGREKFVAGLEQKDRQGQTRRVWVAKRDDKTFPLVRYEQKVKAVAGKQGAAATEEVGPAREIIGDHVVVRLKDDADRDSQAFRDFVRTMGDAKSGLRVKRYLPLTRQILVGFDGTDPERLDQVTDLLSNYAMVKHVAEDTVVNVDLMPGDPRFSEQWGLHNTGQTGGKPDADIDAPEAWETSVGNDAMIVGVIDTGVDYTNPDLQDSIWVNANEIPNNNIDDDNNGYIDDVHGYDFYNDDGDPMDDMFHGTHCAGIIGARGNNSKGVVGVNWKVKIMALKVLSSTGSGSIAVIAEAIQYAAMMRQRYGVNVRVLSNSYGFTTPEGTTEPPPSEQVLWDAIDVTQAAGILFVASAGNEGANCDISPDYPASYPAANVVSVAATDHNDKLASFSNYGVMSVHLGAPGVNILSTMPMTDTPYMQTYRNNGYKTYTEYGTISGTSMACPFVAGAAALIWGQNPSLSCQEVRWALLSGADRIDDLKARSTTGGRLNVAESMKTAGLVIEQVLIDDGTGVGTSGNRDGIINAGETVGLRVVLANGMNRSLTGLTGSLSLSGSNPGVTLTQTTVSYGTLAAHSSSPGDKAFVIQVASGVTVPLSIGMQLAIGSGSGSWTFPMSQTVTLSATVIQGKVTLNGADLSGATVRYDGEALGLGRKEGAVTSDGTGAYSLSLPLGVYHVTASKGDYVPSETVDITTKASPTIEDFPFVSASISGVVRNEKTGVPMAGQQIRYEGPRSGTTVSAADGTYAIAGVYGRAAEETLVVTNADFFDTVVRVTVPPSKAVDLLLGASEIVVVPGTLNVAVDPGQTKTVNLTIRNNGTRPLDWRLRARCQSSNGTGDGVSPNKLVNTFPSPLYDLGWLWDRGAGGICYDGESLWFSGTQDKSFLMVRTNPTTGEILERVYNWYLDLGGDGNLYNDLAWDGRYLWVASVYGQVTAYDPMTKKYVKTHMKRKGRYTFTDDVQMPGPFGLTYGDGVLWLHFAANRVGELEARTIWRMDPETGEDLGSIVIPAECVGAWESSMTQVNNGHVVTFRGYGTDFRMAYADGALWTCDSYVKKVYKLNPETGAILKSFDTTGVPVPGVNNTTVYMYPRAIESDGKGRVWLGSGFGDSTKTNDQITLVETGERPWLTVAAECGQVPGVGEVVVAAKFDGARATAGTHRADITIGSNDPKNRRVIVPVILTVGTAGANRPPLAEAGKWRIVDDTDGNGVETVQLDGSGSVDPDGEALTYAWSEGGTALGTGAVLSKNMPLGRHTVTLTVTDTRGATGTDTVVVEVRKPVVNRPPSAAMFVHPASGEAVLTTFFDATDSADPDDDLLSYSWRVNDGGWIDSSWVKVWFVTSGVYRVELKVDDNRGNATNATATVVVK